jgi:hypothetical protein
MKKPYIPGRERLRAITVNLTAVIHKLYPTVAGKFESFQSCKKGPGRIHNQGNPK